MQCSSLRLPTSLFALLLCSITAGSLSAQSVDRSDSSQVEPLDYGTLDSNYRFLSATNFEHFCQMSSPFPRVDANDYAYLSNGVIPCSFHHEIELPHGALLEDLRLYFFDLTLAADITLELCKSSVETDTGLNPTRSCISAITTAAPGYGSLLLTANETFLARGQVDGDPALEDIRWIAVVTVNDFTNHKFAGVRLKWKRQISPAPPTATFTDVPTNHPFFQFIEALVDSGVTAGCNASPPQYCPDAFLTRGQMAVFLARALGLHWVP